MKKKILVIDDEPPIVKALRYRLESYGYEVYAAHDGEEGLRYVESADPQLIILDIRMPRMDGYEFINRLRANAEKKFIPVIALTANPRMKELFKIEGVTDYLAKPFKERELLDAITKHIGSGEVDEGEVKKVLIVDDDPQIAKVLSLRFESKGYAVVTAENGAVGLQKVKQIKPDVIILDVMMPVMDGFEFLKVIKKDPAQAKIPIIVLTARGAMKDTFELYDVAGFMPKPFDSDELIKMIKFTLQKKVLLLSRDDEFIARTKHIFAEYNYAVYPVANENALVQKEKEGVFRYIIGHLPYIEKDPAAFMAQASSLQSTDTKVIIYSDSRVKGTEANDMVAIDEIRHLWLRVKVFAFFDGRIASGSFEELIEEFLTSEREEKPRG